MLRLIPPPLHRRALQIAHRLRLIWWRLRRPLVQGCRVVAFDAQHRVLLVRHSYGSGRWMPPGGGLRKGEDPVAAGLRELVEETGCVLSDPMLLCVIEEELSGATNRIHVVCGMTADCLRIDGREVIEAEFFSADALPRPMVRGLADALPDWITAAKAALPALR